MGYFLLIMATLSWSFVGVFVKSAGIMVDSATITFLRFFLGIVFLGCFLLIRKIRFQLRSNLKWIWIGAIGKSCNYYFENMALSIGYSYGNILVTPIQTVILLTVSAYLFKDKISPKGWIAAALCVVGIVIISWNGLPLSQIINSNGIVTLLFFLSSIGAAFHVLSQKMLIQSMDAGTMNFSVFFWCSVLMVMPMPFQAEWIGTVNGAAIGSLLMLGLITGLSFYWFSKSLETVNFIMAVMVSNCSVLFTLTWSYLFFHDPITVYILTGAAIFIVGMVLLHVPAKKPTRKLQVDL